MTTTATATISLKDQLKDDTLSLEDKLKAIDEAMAQAKQQTKSYATQNGLDPNQVSVDPADLTMCESCQ